MDTLSKKELVQLVSSVFPRRKDDKALAIITDVPFSASEDNPDWVDRRALAEDWADKLKEATYELGLERVELVAYENVGSQNADLPEIGYILTQPMPPTADFLESSGQPISFEELFQSFQLLLAPTEYSTTAPLKIAAKKYGFRAGTMPGFTAEMIPALRLDFQEINRRCMLLKEKLDVAERANVVFLVDQKKSFSVQFDLRFRSAHASSGCFEEPGTAGNVPSGETYIVPYEGEMDERSETVGLLPVQFDAEIVIYKIDQNRAVAVESSGTKSQQEAEKLEREPAYGNMAELGFGVLADFDIRPIGKILLDEKLGFHVAFGRSDHFGGSVSPQMFSSPQAVEHSDRVYIPQTQPRVLVQKVELTYSDGDREIIMTDGKYTVF